MKAKIPMKYKKSNRKKKKNLGTILSALVHKPCGSLSPKRLMSGAAERWQIIMKTHVVMLLIHFMKGQ